MMYLNLAFGMITIDSTTFCVLALSCAHVDLDLKVLEGYKG
jgi:hypothetical protein